MQIVFLLNLSRNSGIPLNNQVKYSDIWVAHLQKYIKNKASSKEKVLGFE